MTEPAAEPLPEMSVPPLAFEEITPSEFLVIDMRRFLCKYAVFDVPDVDLVLSLYAIATHIGTAFDAFPYLAITSETKQSGKTRVMELLAFLSHNPLRFTAMSDAALFLAVRSGNVTIFVDEQESLGSNATSQRRAILNSGYRRGQSVPRAKPGAEGGLIQWPVYCPKVFVLIGDMTDTLRDRAITIRLTRGTPPERFQWGVAQSEAAIVTNALDNVVTRYRTAILDAYAKLPRMSWLPDRDEELWRPLFAVCAVLVPAYVERLERVAADLCAEKTAPPRRLVDLRGADDAARDDGLAEQLLGDLLDVMVRDQITTADAIAALHALTRAPWRRLHGTGLTANGMAHLLARFDGVKPRVLRLVSRQTKAKTKSKRDTARGYKRSDLTRALLRLRGFTPSEP